MGKINSKQIEADGHLFDSLTEYEYYQHLKQQEGIVRIELQPNFKFMDSFYIECGRCDEGKVPSPKTGRMIQCKRCSGTGKLKRRPWTYTADFQVFYMDGRVEIIDVKGHANERFPLVRKMFEYQKGYELLVAKKTKTGWKYV